MYILTRCVRLFRPVNMIYFPLSVTVSSPRRFRVKVLGQDKLEVSWKEPKGDFEGYKVIYITRPGKVEL